MAQEARDAADATVRRQDSARRRRELDSERKVIEMQIESLQAKSRILGADITRLEREEKRRDAKLVQNRARMARARDHD
jgi:hypothetical protein